VRGPRADPESLVSLFWDADFRQFPPVRSDSPGLAVAWLGLFHRSPAAMTQAQAEQRKAPPVRRLPADQREAEEVTPQWVDATQATAPPDPRHGPPPNSVSPSEWVASEGTLIRMLCRHYGWMTVQPGQLIRHGLAR
jgi:hypothetical protein